VRVLGIGSSAGGPPAVASLLGALAAERGLSVVVAQHMPRDHVDDFAGFLSRRCSLPVTICTGAEQLEPGRVVLPGDGMNLVFTEPNRVAAVPSENPLVPSVDVLFHSMANHLGAACAAVVLSGIGNDGTSGLAALAERGALTLAQDEQSSAVFGMPKSAAPYARHHVSPVEAARVVLGHVALRSRGLSL
jgi:chemotaxis response regulator CheB